MKWCNFITYKGSILLILFFLASTQLYAQQETKPESFSVQAGINKGILDNIFGPSFSAHYAIRRDKVLQLELRFFYNRSSGTSFLNGDSQKSFGTGWVAGTRINIRPRKNWNPSVVIMPGFIYSSEIISNSESSSAISGTLSLAFSNTFYKKHMLSIGVNPGEYNTVINLKYGFWF
jgi:hypothetical protein